MTCIKSLEASMKKKEEERKKQIMKAAFDAVSKLGYDNVTLQDIANHANVSKGVVHYYFTSKQNILLELLESTTNKIYSFEIKEIAKYETAIEKLHAYLNAVFVSPQDNKKFYRVYLDFLAQANGNEAYKKINLKFYENCWGIGQEIIKLGQHEGVFCQDMDSLASAKMMRAMIDGSLIQWLTDDLKEQHQYYKETCLNSILKLLKT
ncbi:transcriptional regulator [Lysinibacillus sphaericus CBAM5]|uniref:Transcriptional regulator n=2 Tax=Lysinibacillus TaxID=400634 RepID=W7S3G2_LYSSH|nr:transcriptional regulator [Lysinibacillus sphaericus CBAM5]EWH33556.1 transcriptional regulator [Lysinibacillus sphaericus CBAM5]